MTPFAMRVARAAIAKPPNGGFVGALLSATCFDITPVQELVSATGLEAWDHGHMRDGEPWMEHGGLLFAPSEFTWIEARNGQFQALGALIHSIEDQLCFTAVNADGKVWHGFMELQPDGEHFVVRPEIRDPRVEEYDWSARLGLYFGAALLLINAPRGVERVSAHAHRGFEREVRRSIGRRILLRPIHTIRLSKVSGDVGDGAGRPGTSKGFHFCRSHLRRLPSGTTTRVRAHWRGDPSLGVCRANYEVAA